MGTNFKETLFGNTYEQIKKDLDKLLEVWIAETRMKDAEIDKLKHELLDAKAIIKRVQDK